MPAVASIETFGEMLKFVRRRARLTQRELAIAVGYTEAHICRLEKNERLPDLTTVAALFIPALFLEDEPELLERLLKLATSARSGRRLSSVTINQITIEHQVEMEIGALEEIPALHAHYVARPKVIRRVSAMLARERVVVLCGMPGIGKTVLAATVAHDYKQGPVFWQTFAAGVNTGVEIIVRQLALFFLAHGQTRVKPLVESRTDAKPMPLDQQIMLLRAALAQRPALLCFDDAHLICENELSLSLLRHLSETTSASILLTSREDLPLPASQISLDGLERSEARELIAQFELNLEDEVADRLMTRTGSNPVLLRLAAGQLTEAKSDAAAFVEHIETQPQVVSYLLNTVLDDLSPATRWLATLISVFRQPVDLYDEFLNELIGDAGQPCCLDNAMTELQHRYLINDVCRAALHPLVRDHLYAALAVEPARKKQLHAIAADWSELAQGDIVEAAHHWVNADDLEQAAEIISSQSELLFDRGKAPTAILVVDEALERIQHRRGNTSELRRRLLTARGDLLRGTLRAAEAETSYREALALAHNMPSLRAQIVRNLAQILMQRGQAAEGLRLCQSANADLSAGDTVLLARVAAIECRAHLVLSQYDEAEKIARYALGLADQFAEYLPQLADDVRARAERTLGWVSYTRHPQGDEALAHFRRALDCARRAGLRMVENAALSNLGTALTERGDYENAIRTYQEALDGCKAMGDMYATASILHNLGHVHHVRLELEAALDCIIQACEIEKSIGDADGLLSSQQAHASILLEMGKVAEARLVLDNALAGEQESTDTWTMGSCLCTLAEVQLLQGEVETARSTIERVLAMPGIEENARIHSWALGGLALMQMVSGEIEAARKIVADPPAEDLGLELTIRWLLVQIAVSLAGGDLSRPRMIVRSMESAASQQDFREAITWAENMIAKPNLLATDFVRLILIGNLD